MKSTLSILAATLLAVACGGKQPDMVVTAATQAPVTKASALPAGHPDISHAQQASMLSGGASQHMTTANTADVKVPKADGANAKTIAELWSGKDTLKGKPVVVRGKVVKSLSGIMGKNWIHLRDGSSDRDITVTTDAVANVGDVVVVSGVLSVDKDFGAGYTYPVIIEDGKVAK